MNHILVLLLLFPSICFGAFTEFYMQSGGSNLNAGSTNNNTALYTSTSGNWVQSTRVFTPTDGVNPVSAGVTTGMFASVYLNAASVGVYIGRISAVQNATNGTITIDGTVNYGSAPANSTGGITIKVGGAWLGPNSAVVFPFGLSNTLGGLVDTNTDQVRINVKNDQTYTMTATLSFNGIGGSTLQGYSSSVGDGGRATFTSNITSAANFTQSSGSPNTYIDLIFANTGASNSNHVFDTNASGTTFFRCVFHGGRGSGLIFKASAPIFVIECEAYDNNKSNGAALGGFSTQTNAGLMVCVNCYSHDNTGSNSAGFVQGSAASGFALINCIAESNGGRGLELTGGSSTNGLFVLNSNFYNNTSDGIKFNNANQTPFAYIVNNNFLKNGGKGINNTLTIQTGIVYNNGYGAGTQANGSTDALGSIRDTSTDITYANDVTPWVSPTTGDFSINLSAAQGVGRGFFLETDGTNTGTVGYPDIGAAQAFGAPYPTPTATATATATPTATPTSTPTPTTPPENSHPFGG